MNDDFLYSLRKPPRREFSEKLYEKISIKERRIPMFSTKNQVVYRMAFVFTALCLAFGLALGFSPGARAKLIEIVHQIGNMTITETDERPDDGEPEGTWPSETMSLAEARTSLPFSFELPAWVPEGYVLNEQDVVVYDLPTEWGEGSKFIEFSWEKALEEQQEVVIDGETLYHTRSILHLHIEWAPGSEYAGNFLVGPGGLEELKVNGEPAALVRGAWNADTNEWGAEEMLMLRWQKGDIVYSLSVIEHGMSVEELVQVAESIP